MKKRYGTKFDDGVGFYMRGVGVKLDKFGKCNGDLCEFKCITALRRR